MAAKFPVFEINNWRWQTADERTNGRQSLGFIGGDSKHVCSHAYSSYFLLVLNSLVSSTQQTSTSTSTSTRCPSTSTGTST